jgi:hypothetical protein
MCAMRNLFALTLIGILLPCTAMAEQFTLVCHLAPVHSNSPPEGDRNFTIDLDKSSVDGRPATINENMIFWETAGKGSTFTQRINRITGSIEVADSEVGVIFTGHCEKATQRKF